MNKEKVLHLLGLCMRARMLVLGEENVMNSLKQKKYNLVFLASDAGENIKKKVKDKANTYNAELVDQFSSKELSKAIGKENRKVILVQDKGFINTFNKYFSS